MSAATDEAVADGCAVEAAQHHGLSLSTFRAVGRAPMRGDWWPARHDPNDTTTPAAPTAVRVGPGDC